MAKTEVRRGLELPLALYLFELSLLVMALAVYKKGEQSLVPFLFSRPGIVGLAASLTLATSSALLLRHWLSSRRLRSKVFRLTVAAHLVTLVILLTTIEGAIRLFSTRDRSQPAFAGTRLLPLAWGEVAAHNRRIIAEAESSYFVSDNLLGWTVGPNRRSRNGLYFSSQEGIRSPRPQMTFSGHPGVRRIALVGDSFTFGMEVGYEDSWGYLLDADLGSEVQILNFGVDGYGVDQAYLRFHREVRDWRPDVVIFGFINHDLYRSLAVYGFLLFPQSELPFPKPRFVLRQDGLSLLNTPLIDPETIFSKDSIAELPFLEYDPHYKEGEWEWHPFCHSYFFRLLISRFPRYPPPNPRASEENTVSLNAALFSSFVKTAKADGAVPIVVHFPSRSHFGLSRLAWRVLEKAGIEVADLTPCLAKVDASQRFLEGRAHYSPTGNSAVAECMRDLVLQHLPSVRPREEALLRGQL